MHFGLRMKLIYVALRWHFSAERCSPVHKSCQYT